MVDITVVIPTYNGAHRLPEVLERLRSQIYTETLNWEVIVIDNNSTDDTATVVQNYQTNWSEAFPLRYCFEAEQGAAFARLRGIRESRGELVGFLDDDTLPESNWIAAAHDFGQAYPKAGAYCSQIHGDFEVEPPENFGRIKVFLAIIERGSKPHQYTRRKKMLPPSAGLVVRKKAWLESVPPKPFLSGRTSQSMLTSEDTEVIAYLQTAGWEIWYNPEMELYHKIPRKRLEREYLLPMVRGIGLARHHIRMVRTKAWLRPFIIPAYMANDVRMVVLHFIKYRTVIKSDLAAACEMEFLSSSLVSPFYIWGRQIAKVSLGFMPKKKDSSLQS